MTREGLFVPPRAREQIAALSPPTRHAVALAVDNLVTLVQEGDFVAFEARSFSGADHLEVVVDNVAVRLHLYRAMRALVLAGIAPASRISGLV